ncbi:MAG: TetR/AcrR family transcriptional regulator [Clostridia bacterium]|nr:TetR/AcrR family transcriptional regulator [Clostridia bacterium]
MKLTGYEDLRVQKTIEAIRSVFEQMICEMDYHQMTVKELCERARINKKTFYRYYPTMDDLLMELQTEMSSEYIEMISHYRLPEQLDKVNEAFFRYSVSKGEVYEKITCASSYVTIRNTMIYRVNEATWYKSAWFNNIPPWQRRMLIVFVQYTIVELYRQWVADGKTTPVDEVIKLSNALICQGIDGFRNPQIKVRQG